MEAKLEPLQVAVGVSMSKPVNLWSTMPVPLMQTLLLPRSECRGKAWYGWNCKIIRPSQFPTFTTGTLTIDTDNAEINHSDGSFLAGS